MLLLWIPCAIIALALVRWFPQALAVMFGVAVIALAFSVFYVLSFF